MKAQNQSPLLPLAALLVLAAAAPSAFAQNEAAAAPNVYKVDFTLTLREGTQSPAAARKFSMIVEAGARGQIRSSTRIAVPSNFQPGTAGGPLVATQYQFSEAGVNITCELRERSDRVTAHINIGVTDPTESTPPAPPNTNNEAVESTVTLTPGRPLSVLAWDAAGGKRHYEVEVTASRMK